jgi:RNA polymerase sigma-70 factor (ECF subfamily)
VEDGTLEVGVSARDADAAAAAGSRPSPPSRSSIDYAAEERALASVRRGRKDEALRILMMAYGHKITAFAQRMLRQSELANDVRQQVFLQAFQGFDNFKGRSSLWTWLCGIAYHRCVDELRRNGLWNIVEDVDTVDDLLYEGDASLDPEQLVKRRALERCLMKLPGSLRSQLLMRCFFGLSYIEIAELVGASHPTVQVRISRILPRLRRCLRGEGVAR